MLVNMPGKGSGGEPAEKRCEDYFLASEGQAVVVCMNDHHRANDEASFASEQPRKPLVLPRGLGLSLFRWLRSKRFGRAS